MNALVIDRVRKSYGGLVAVDGLSLVAAHGGDRASLAGLALRLRRYCWGMTRARA